MDAGRQKMQGGTQTAERNESHRTWLSAGCLLAVLSLLQATSAAGQEARREGSTAAEASQLTTPSPQASSTPLAKLLEEADVNNPQILAARHAWRAATQVASQVSTLPDPQVVVQQFSVGSPRPFAGFSNSDFAYIGVGVSQDLPYPGKLRLRGEVADREAASARERVEVVRRAIREQLKATYFQFAYLQRTLTILERNGKVLEQIEKIAEARYRVGQGNQQDVLKAQLQRTKLLREVAMRHQEVGQLQARLKQILNRPPDSPDLAAEELTETSLPYTADELLARVRAQNPEVRGQQEMVRRQGLQVELAHKDFYPDFNLQYMWQHNAEQFRDYYMLTFGVRIPIHRRRKQEPELAQAVEELNRSRRQYEAQVQQAYFDVRDQLVTAETAAQLLKIYRDGLIPQATATFQAGLAAYQSNREDFETLLGSFLDVLNFDLDYWRTLADHETALAQIEKLTGVTLP
jgi:outer membrane protein TolC